MLRISIRNFHQTVKVSNAHIQINEYLQYFKTPRELRPLVYRKKNSSELLSRDLFNDETKSRIVPLSSPQLPSKSTLSKLIMEVDSIDELYNLRDQMLALSKKPSFTTNEHINVFLEKSAELNKLPHALTFIYSQKSLRNLLNHDNLNFISILLYLNPNKSLENKLQKFQIANEKIKDSSSPISCLLKACYYVQSKNEIPNDLLSNQQTIQLPQLDLTKNIGNLAKFFNQNRFLYLQLKPIELESSYSEILEKNSKSIIKFVQDYEKLIEILGKNNPFEELKEKSRFDTKKIQEE